MPGNPHAAIVLAELGFLALEQGDWERAAARAGEGAALLVEQGARFKLAECLERAAPDSGLGKLAQSLRDLGGSRPLETDRVSQCRTRTRSPSSKPSRQVTQRQPKRL